MQCPIDNNTLQMTTRDGIEIDYCPVCRGVWLDRGELDKLIERTGSFYSGNASHNNQPQTRRYDDDDDYDHHRSSHEGRHYDDHHSSSHHKKKEGFLGDLFDF